MYLLSNTSGLHKEYFLRTFDIFQHFQDGVYSYLAGCAKPGEEIFHQAIVRLDLDPGRTFYIDDLLPTSRPLRGWVSGHFTTALPGIRRCRRSLMNGWEFRALVDGRNYLS
jgi:hypothetical protein